MPVAALFMGLFFGMPFDVSAAVAQRDVSRQPGESIRCAGREHLLVEKAKLAPRTEEPFYLPRVAPNPLTRHARFGERRPTPRRRHFPVATPVGPLTSEVTGWDVLHQRTWCVFRSCPLRQHRGDCALRPHLAIRRRDSSGLRDSRRPRVRGSSSTTRHERLSAAPFGRRMGGHPDGTR